MTTHTSHRPAARAALIALAALALLWPAATSAQTGPRLVPVPRGDTVFLYIMSPPPLHSGLLVDRALAGEAPERLTPAPLRPARSARDVEALLGTELDPVMGLARVSHPAQLLSRLRSSPLAGLAATALYPAAADALARRYVDADVEPGLEYDYRVTLLGPTGAPLGDPLTTRVRVQDREPGAPAALRAQSGDGEVLLEWEYPPYRAGDHAVGFHVYRRAAGGDSAAFQRLNQAPILRNDAAPRAFRDTTAGTGIRYEYQVRAVDLVRRQSGPSPFVVAAAEDRTPPAPPRDVVAVAGDGEVYLVWRRAPDADAAGYLVTRAERLEGPFLPLHPRPLPVTSPEWLDTEVTPDVQYFYRVQAVDEAGNESAPHGLAQALPVDRTPPAPPTAPAVEVNERRLTIRWTPSPSDDVLGYYIYRGDAPDRLVRLVSRPVAETVYVDSGFDARGLAPGGRYTVEIAAVDRAYNESEAVGVQVDVPDDEAPTPPTAFTAHNVRGRYVELRWSPSVALDVARYALSRVPLGDAAAGAEAVDLGTVAAERGAASLRDTTAAVGNFEYRLVAVDSAGNRSGPAVATIELADRHRPATPRYPTARQVDAGVRVAWQRVASRDLVGYHVYRAALPTGHYRLLTPEPLTALELTDPQGEPHHYYVVRAVDRSGNESAASEPIRVPPRSSNEESRP